MNSPRKTHAVLWLCSTMLLPLDGAFAQGKRLKNAHSAPLRVTLISDDHVQTIYRHLVQNHYVPETGLFLSFPDSGDLKLSQQASLYDQGAVGLLAIRLQDYDRARGILRFLKQAWASDPLKPGVRQGIHGLANYYNGEFGTAGIEKTIHVGPNAWAGLFAARLANATHDNEALQFARDIAYWIAHGIPHENGAVAMGPMDDPGGAPWAHVYSTENNLSYYAMLTEMLRSPHLEIGERVSLTQERDRLENWLITTAFNRNTYTVCRGINPHGTDHIRALDTVTWFISALGPRKLAERGIDPHRLMAQAEKSFVVKLGNSIGVDPTDEAEARIVSTKDRPGPNHRMIWYEGLGQFMLASSVLADYSQHTGQTALAEKYMAQVKEYASAFDQAALKNYAGGAAYPYATPGKFFRDGWHTPEGSAEGPASSLIAGVWRCFSGLGMDPVAGRDVGTIQPVHVLAPRIEKTARRRPPTLYGTSEEMVVQAWKALEGRDFDRAVQQSRATIQEWSTWARQLQQKKLYEVGRAIEYTGAPQERQAIFNYWALNDVGAAYFILGKALDEKRDYANASRAFQQIVNHYSLAQVWDPHGWFWSPVEAITNDYVLRDPAHYGDVMPQVLAEGSLVGKNPN